MRLNWMRKILHADQGQTQNHKEENLPALHQEYVPLGEGIGLTSNQGNKYSFSDYEVSQKVTFLLRQSQQMHREEDGAIHFWRIKKIFRVSSHNLFIGLTVGGKHAWQQEEEIKEDSSVVLMFQEQLFISELFSDIQDAILLIFHYRTM